MVVSPERLALAEARAFIADVCEHGGIASPEAVSAYRRWLDEHPFDMQAALAVMRGDDGLAAELERGSGS